MEKSWKYARKGRKDVRGCWCCARDSPRMDFGAMLSVVPLGLGQSRASSPLNIPSKGERYFGGVFKDFCFGNTARVRLTIV